MTGWHLWALSLGFLLLTLGFRGAFFFRPQAESPPAPSEHDIPTLRRLLDYATPAMLATLVTQALVGGTGTALLVARWLAGGIGLVVAIWSATRPKWRRHGLLLTTLCGMGALLGTLALFR